MKFITLLCVTMCLSAIAENVWSHSVLGRIGLGKGVLVEAEYDDGEPMTYASIEIFGRWRLFGIGTDPKSGIVLAG